MECRHCNKDADRCSGRRKNKELCNSCVTLRRRARAKRRAVAYLGGACAKCGYSKCLSALSFHHQGKDKAFSISPALTRGLAWEKLRLELDKCKLLCANCHREGHWPGNWLESEL